MSKLEELENRLRDEPENLGLRVMLAGALHEAGRRGDAALLYRSVAIAYRAQGRAQQAIAVCRSVLELVPDDAPCQALLAAMLASPPATSASGDAMATPPPYHVADRSIARADLPQHFQDELERYHDISGIANAARQISESLIAARRQLDLDEGDGIPDDDLSAEIDTQRIPGITVTTGRPS